MDIPHIEDLDLSGKKVLLRVDFNVKVKDGKIKDDTRISAALPTINYILDKGAKLIIMSHLGRPQEDIEKGKSIEEVKQENSMMPVATNLSEKIGKEVKLAPDCIGEEVKKISSELKEGEVLMLENLRLHKGEEANNPEFVEGLSNLADVYVNDAFGTAHRWHASTAGVPLFMIKQKKPVAMGMLMKKELGLWSEARSKQGGKLLVIGGKKLKEKMKAANKLSEAVDNVLVGGAVYNAIMKGKGFNVGSSVVSEKDKDYSKDGKEIAEKASNLLLAESVIISSSIEDVENSKEIRIEEGVPEDSLITDIIIDENMASKIGKPDVAIIFGPTGIFDYGYDKSVKKLVELLQNTYVIVGGGESADAYKGLNAVISTGGGASIKLYTKGTLDALEALKGNADYAD